MRSSSRLYIVMVLAWPVVLACGGKGASTAAKHVDTGTSSGNDSATNGEFELPVDDVERVECTGDTGGRKCNDERKGISAAFQRNGSINVEDIGVYINCAGVSPVATAKPEEAVIDVVYTSSGDADCECMHAISYRIQNVTEGEWEIRAREHHANVTPFSRDTGG